MSLSINEMAALCKKATRGAGFSWGVAEEVDVATRWLIAFDLFDAGCLAQLLETFAGKQAKLIGPTAHGTKWQAVGGTMFPILAGAYYCDLAKIAVSQEIHLRSVDQPIFLLPFVAHAARVTECSLQVTSSFGELCTNGHTLFGNVEVAQLSNMGDVQISVAPQTLPQSQRTAHKTRYEMSAKAQDRLLALAHKTYAPATEESRLLGAGAGTNDND